MAQKKTVVALAVLVLLALVGAYFIEAAPAPSATLSASATTTTTTASTTSSSAESSSQELGLGQEAEVDAVDQNGTELIVSVLVNGSLDGYTPQFVNLAGNSTASVSCQPLPGFSSVSTGPFNATAGQVVTCAYDLATSISTNGTVSLIINTYEPGYGQFSYGQVQITNAQGKILQAGFTGAAGSGAFTVPANSQLTVEWIGMGGVSLPAALQELTTGTITPEVLTLSGNPAQSNNPCVMVNANAC